MRLAWLCLQRGDFDDAVARTCAGIRAHAGHLDATATFHWTITEAQMYLQYEIGAADRGVPREGFQATNTALMVRYDRFALDEPGRAPWRFEILEAIHICSLLLEHRPGIAGPAIWCISPYPASHTTCTDLQQQ